MKRIVMLALVALPLAASAQGVKRDQRPPPEVTIASPHPGAAVTAGMVLGGYVVGERPLQFTAIIPHVSTASGGGAGTTVFQVSDGTNLCTSTFTCTSTQATGSKRVATANAGGTGCIFAPGATLIFTVSATGCTTTQPNVRNVVFVGRHL